jgi:hypothetical protein|tara:strand:+ start:1041 stop:1391 length:351 start_codon:yes stop_codon:yes gene_type:complete
MISLKMMMMMMMMMMMKMMMKMFRFSSLSLDRSRRRSAKDLFSLGDTHPPIGGEQKRFQFYDDDDESCCCSSKRLLTRFSGRRRTRERGRPFGGRFGGVPSRCSFLVLSTRVLFMG